MAAMFTSTNGYSVANLYRTNSLGQVSLSGDVVGPFQLDFASTSCDTSAWAQAADAQASASGVDVASYQRKVYVMPSNSCSMSGYGTVGGSPSQAWVFACDVNGVYAHEVGHTLRMHHASTPAFEYEDTTDPMAIAAAFLGVLALAVLAGVMPARRAANVDPARVMRNE